MEDSICHALLLLNFLTVHSADAMRKDSQDLIDCYPKTFGSVSHLKTTPGTGIVHLGYSTKPLTQSFFQETEHVF